MGISAYLGQTANPIETFSQSGTNDAPVRQSSVPSSRGSNTFFVLEQVNMQNIPNLLPLLNLIPAQQQSITHWLEYWQISSFLSSFSSGDVFNKGPDTFESLLLQDTGPVYIFSVVYRILILKFHLHLPEFTNGH